MKKKQSPHVDAAPEQGASGERCSVAAGSAIYETHYHSADHPQWVTRIHHGPYVAYHYTQEAADQLTDMLNERSRLRAALVQIEGNDRYWNARWASIVAAEALSPNTEMTAAHSKNPASPERSPASRPDGPV